MDRRRYLVGFAATAGLAGCLSEPDEDQSGSTPSPTGKGPTDTPERRTADGVSARFRVTDAHTPTDDTASATFDGETVTVTGTMDPTGCNEPTLSAMGYRSRDAVVSVSVGTEPRFGPTATVECDNASYDYRCTVTVERGTPEAVEVVHAYEGKDDGSFNLEPRCGSTGARDAAGNRERRWHGDFGTTGDCRRFHTAFARRRSTPD